MSDRKLLKLQEEIETLKAELAAMKRDSAIRPYRVLRRLLADPRVRIALAVALIATPLPGSAATIWLPYSFSNGTIADANAVNANFSALVAESNDQDSRLTEIEAAVAALDQEVATTDLAASGNANIGGDLAVTGSSAFASDVSMLNASTTALTVNGNTVLGHAGSDTITFNGRIATDLDLNFNELKNSVLENISAFPSSPAEGQMFWHTTNKKPYWYDATNTRWRAPAHAVTLLVAALDSLNKETADYVCDGTGDQVEIGDALAALPAGGGEVKLLEGTYNISSDLTLPTDSQLSLAKSAVLSVDPGVTVTVNGSVSAPTAQVFSGDGTVVWSNHQPIHPEYFGIDGSGDEIEINKAISSLPPTGGEVRLLGGRTYSINDTINVKSHVRFIGQGVSTRVLASGSFTPESITPMIEVMDDHHHTEVSNIWFQSNQNINLYGWHGYNGSYNNWVHHCYWSDFRSVSGGAVDPSGSMQNMISNNVFYDCTTGYFGTDTNNQYGNIITDNIFLECRDSMKFAYPYDITVNGNIVESTKANAMGISIGGTYNANGRVVIANNVIRIVSASSVWASGISLFTGGPAGHYIRRIVITGNSIEVPENVGIKLWGNASRLLIMGNTIRTTGDRHGISVIGYDEGYRNEDIDIIGNHFHGESGADGIFIDNAGHANITIKDNHIFDYGHGIRIDGGGTPADNTRILGNIFTDVSVPITNGGTNTVIHRNIGYVTENSGTAAISSGSTYVDVAHGLDVAPAMNNISAVPTNDLGNASKFWIGEVGATTFRIHVDADPAADATFSWQIGSH